MLTRLNSSFFPFCSKAFMGGKFGFNGSASRISVSDVPADAIVSIAIGAASIKSEASPFLLTLGILILYFCNQESLGRCLLECCRSFQVGKMTKSLEKASSRFICPQYFRQPFRKGVAVIVAPTADKSLLLHAISLSATVDERRTRSHSSRWQVSKWTPRSRRGSALDQSRRSKFENSTPRSRTQALAQACCPALKRGRIHLADILLHLTTRSTFLRRGRRYIIGI